MADYTAHLALRVQQYPTSQKFALYRIAQVVNSAHEWDFFMTPEKLAAELSSKPSTVRRWMAAFVRDGFLERIEEGGGKGHRTRWRWCWWPAEKLLTGEQKAENCSLSASNCSPVSTTAPRASLGNQSEEPTRARSEHPDEQPVGFEASAEAVRGIRESTFGGRGG